MSTAGVWIPPLEFEEYRLVRELGRGAMGEVWLAQDTLLDRPVAIKFVANEPDVADSQRFLIEARAIARLSHPNVVAVHRVGEVRRRPYLVSEFVRGEPLDRLAKPVEPARLLEIATGLARGLAAAHRRGVLHRDIKPANAILADDGNVKLLDFGLAKLQGQPADSMAVTLPLKASDPRQTDVGDPVGTPLYMAPELWRNEPATTHSDVYGLAALLYELAAGRAPHDDVPLIDLPRVVQERAAQPLRELAPALDPALAATIDRCLSRVAAERLADGDAVREAIEETGLARRSARTLPAGNPYRGLAAFEAEHRALFFGRGTEMLAIVERLRNEPFVLVAGDSGVGKSSLCAAGVLPALREEGFAVIRVLPGRHPVRALAAALTGPGDDEAALAAAIAQDPHALGAELRRRKPIVLFVDQLEELVTLAEPVAAGAAAEALGALAAVRAPGVRLLATVRNDFLGRVAALPSLGEEAARGVFLLRPLGEDGLREAVTGPARAKNVRFESDALVSALVDAGREAGGLPLLQFALAELWEGRDEAARVIPSAALAALGGVGGALARHADGVIARLPPIERAAARRILGRLVTVEGTRARRGEHELLPPRDPGARAALDALVAGRLLLAREADRAGEGTYELAHEALLAAWGTLRGWLDADADRRAARQRIEQAAAEWERLGHARDALLGPRRLAEAAVAQVAELGSREAAFLAASRAAVRRGRAGRMAAFAFVPLLIALVYLGVRTRQERELSRAVAAHKSAAEQSLAQARAADREVEALRRDALARFDASDWETAEAMWSRALEAGRAVEATYASAGRSLEAAFALDGRRSDVRALLADVTLDRALLAERDGKSELHGELVGRLESYDDGTRRARLRARARLSIRTEPAGAAVLVEQPAARRALGVTPLSRVAVEPGSYVLLLGAPGYAPVRLPILVAPGEQLELRIPLPAEHAVPPGFIYVPAGRFLYGSDDEALRKAFFGGPPLHPVTTPAYLIARTEVTFADWITFLRALPRAERARRTPASEGQVGETVKAALRELADGTWQLALQPTSRMYLVREGDPVHYPDRDRHADQDWRRFPVTSISYEDSLAYAAWLDRTGRVPGARLCNDREWERAARGADSRHFPAGNVLMPDDANYDVTYGRRELAFGPDEVGSHTRSRSPFGLDDIAGNAWEWSRSLDGKPQARGGSWYHGSLTCRIENRQTLALTTRNPRLGLRLCADVRN